MRPALKHCCLATLSILLWSTEAAAQEPGETPVSQVPVTAEAEGDVADDRTDDAVVTPAKDSPPSDPWQVQDAQRPAAPDVYLLPDGFGKLRKVLGFRYEDFLQAWNRDDRSATKEPPQYVIDTVEISGEKKATHARLRIAISVTVQSEGWVDIPIQLPGLIIQQLTISNQAEGECIVFDKQRFGHVVWLSGRVGKQRTLILEGMSKLKLNTGSHGVELYVPRATSSKFSLRLPDSNTRFEAAPELSISKIPRENNTVEVHVIGQANPLRLSWMPAEEVSENQAASVEVESETKIHIDRRRVTYDTMLMINSFERPLEQIHVRLPEKAKLQVGEAVGVYKIQEIVQLPNDSRGNVVRIRLADPLLKPWKLHLTAERPIESFNDSTECVVEGFEVLEAFHQAGTLTLEVDDRLQAYFDAYGAINQTPLDASAAAPEGSSIFGRFRYTRFPWQLAVFTSPRQRRVRVEPRYALTINSGEAQLDVEYNYQLIGAQIFSLQLNLQGWDQTDALIESGGLVDTDRVVETRDKRLILPLVDSESQQLRLNISFRKDIDLGDNTFYLPEPLEADVVDGQLTVDSAESLRVTPKIDELTGLNVVSTSDGLSTLTVDPRSSERQEQIRLRTFLSRPKFVAEVIQRQRKIDAKQRTWVTFDQQIIRVRQQVDYQSRYRPVSQLAMFVPQQLWLNDSLAITLGGEPLSFGLGYSLNEKPLQGVAADFPDDESSLRQLVVSLPRAMQNDIPLEITYEIPTPELSSDELTAVLLPLATPKEPVSSNEAAVTAPQPLIVTANQRSGADRWAVVTEASDEEDFDSSLRLRADESLSYLSLYAQIDTAEKVQLATLERAWIQSWISAGQRQERAVFRFRSEHPVVTARLPVDLENPRVEVLLDGEPQSFELLADNRLKINLPEGSQRGNHSLELRYQQPTLLPSWGTVECSLPYLECRTASAPIYWQLILPRSWQVTTSPPKLTGDYWLGWKNYRWGRQPNLSQQDLEQITGAVTAVGPTPLSTQYVYRAFDVPNKVQVVVIRQGWLFMIAALSAFGFGLLWLYTSLAQSGLFWFSLALALFTGIFSYPEITLLVIEVILAGGVMTFAASVIRRAFSVGDSLKHLETYAEQQETTDEFTEAWQLQPADQQESTSETTTALRTGGPLP